MNQSQKDIVNSLTFTEKFTKIKLPGSQFNKNKIKGY